MFFKEANIIAQGVLELSEYVDSLEGEPDARVHVCRSHAHSDEYFGSIGNDCSSTLVVFPELPFPLLNVIEDVTKSSRSRWRHNALVGPMQLGLAPGPDGYYYAAPGVKAVARFSVVEHNLFLTVKTKVEVSP